MEKKRKNQIEILKKLKAFEKPYFKISDFEKIFGLKKESLYVKLNRLVKSGLLKRLQRGLYEVIFSEAQIEEIANQIYWPSYLSLESALAKAGIIDQIPYTLTFVTPKKSKKIILGNREVEYRQIKKKLFFGYKKEGKILIAAPEKALIDQIYFYSLGKAFLNFKGWDFCNLKKEKLLRYSKPYPKKVREILKQVLDFMF